MGTVSDREPHTHTQSPTHTAHTPLLPSTQVRPDDTTKRAYGEKVAAMPPSLAAANIATAWWPEAAWGTFLLLTMRGASMSYHVSLEHHPWT